MLRKSIIAVLFLVLVSQVYAQDSLTLGETVEATAEGQTIDWTFSATEGQTYLIQVVSDAFDANFAVKDGDTELLYVEDTNFGEYSQNPTGVFLAPASQDYTLTIGAFYADPAGAYTVTVSEVDYPQVAYDTPIEVNATEAGAQFFVLQGTAGDVVNVFVTGDSDESDTSISLQFGGREVTYDFDNGAEYNPYIRRFTLPSTGAYLIILSSYDTSSPISGVTLNVNKTEALPLVVGEAQTFTLGSETDYEVLTFNVEEDAVYTLTATLNENASIRGEIQPTDPDQYDYNSFDISGSFRGTTVTYVPTFSGEVALKLYFSAFFADSETIDVTLTLTQE